MPRNRLSWRNRTKSPLNDFRAPSATPSPSESNFSLSTASHATTPSSLEIPSLSVDYKALDAEDPSLPHLGWLSSLALLGVSKNETSDRYRALAKFRRVTGNLRIDDISVSDFLRAFGVYAAMVDRSAKETLKAQHHAEDSFDEKSTPSTPKRPRAQPFASGDSSSAPSFTPSRRSFEDTNEREDDLLYHWESFPELALRSRRSSSRISNELIFATSSPVSIPSLPAEKTSSATSSPPILKRASSQTPPPIPATSEDVRVEHVQLLYHMLRHAESIYGFPINIASAPATTLTRVTDRGIICSRTGLSSSDLKRATFSADAFLPAHYVAADRQIKAVVICVRGTANLVDSLTDVAATQDPLNILRDEGGQDIMEGFGHSGVLRSARNLFKNIRNDTLAALRENPGFELFITGHSLGAATASVLALIIRDDPEFPRALAFCFAPMPCMTFELAERTAEFTVTLVNGPDIVPKLGVSQLMPYFATARYVANLSRSRKALLTLGMYDTAIDWEDMKAHNESFVDELRKLHNESQMYIPGKVFQLVRKNEVHRRDAVKNKLFKKRQVEIVAVPRAQFLEVRSRERGMFLSHAPVTYRGGLVNVLKSMQAKPLKTMSAGRVLRHMLTVPLATSSSRTASDMESLETLLDRLGTGDSTALPSWEHA